MQTQNQTQSQDPKRIQKLISFSPRLYENATIKAKNIGFTFSDYVKFLIASDIKTQIEKVEFFSQEEEESIARGVEDYKHGLGFLAKSNADIDRHLDSLV
jgi:hypothetical protein